MKSKGGFLRRRHEGTTDCGDMYQWARFSNNVSQWVKLPSVGFALSCRNGTFTADCVCFRQTLCNSGSLWGYLALWGPVCDASGQEQTRTPHALNAQQQQTNLRLDCAQMEAVTVATVTVSPFSPCHVGDNQYFLTVPRWRQSVLTMWRCPQSCRDKRLERCHCYIDCWLQNLGYILNTHSFHPRWRLFSCLPFFSLLSALVCIFLYILLHCLLKRKKRGEKREGFYKSWV